MRKLIRLMAILPLLAAGCGRRGTQASYIQKTFVLNVPAQFMAYGPATPEMKQLADEIFAEWARVAAEYSYSDPFSQTALLNKKAPKEWVKVDEEFFRLLTLGLEYYRLTGGAFDVTFAPLWPLWKEAASSRRMPARADIEKALSNMGSGHIQTDSSGLRVRYDKEVQVNLGGLLRGYCFERADRILAARKPAYPIQLRLGGNSLYYGERSWQYRVPDPFRRNRIFGRLRFNGGMVMSSSGRDVFVEIEGRRYSHILDLRTGYPIEDFSNLIIYFPDEAGGKFLSSAALSVLGREKAFEYISRIKGAAAVWVDGAGKPHYLFPQDSKARWEEEPEILGGVLAN